MNSLHKYWFEFDVTPPRTDVQSPYIRLAQGCGVTAFTCDDALSIIFSCVGGKRHALPSILACIENPEIETLKKGHIFPAIWNHTRRGIWYPHGYEQCVPRQM